MNSVVPFPLWNVQITPIFQRVACHVDMHSHDNHASHASRPFRNHNTTVEFIGLNRFICTPLWQIHKVFELILSIRHYQDSDKKIYSVVVLPWKTRKHIRRGWRIHCVPHMPPICSPAKLIFWLMFDTSLKMRWTATSEGRIRNKKEFANVKLRKFRSHNRWKSGNKTSIDPNHASIFHCVVSFLRAFRCWKGTFTK